MNLLVIALLMWGPVLPTPNIAVELASADNPYNGLCHTVGYGLREATGGNRPTFERRSVLFQRRAQCSLSDLTPIGDWYEAHTVSADELTYLSTWPGDYVLLFYGDTATHDVLWSYVWLEDGVYRVYTAPIAPQYEKTRRPLPYVATDGVRVDLNVGGDPNLHTFLLVPPTTWVEVPPIGIPTLYLPALIR